jgi:hypothetical protein
VRDEARLGCHHALDAEAARLEDRLSRETLPDRLTNRIEKQADMLRHAAERDRLSFRLGRTLT